MSSPLGLHTDLYEIRMVESYLRRGLLAPATFSMYIRPTPQRPWLLAAGLERAAEVLDRYRFTSDQLDYLRGQGVDRRTLDWLSELEVTGELWTVPDGTVVLGDEPLLELTAPLPVAQLLETALLNVVHLDTLLATKAARCVLAAAGRPVVDFGFRRAHGFDAAMRAAYTSYLAGCAATSNVEAGMRWGIPITGTMAHSFVQVFGDDAAAFRAFATDHPDGATLLVDTFDPKEGVHAAIEVARELAADGVHIGAIRLDSGDLDSLSRWARQQLDAAGLEQVRIFASGGLDEFRIAALVAAGAPIDGFGVGSALVVSADRPVLDIVYKLVAYDGEPRAKHSPGKATLPGPKQIWRQAGPDTDVLELRDAPGEGEALLRLRWRDGQHLWRSGLAEARDRAAAELARLPDAWRSPQPQDPPPRPRLGPALAALSG